jgi:hypothetical protein
VVPTNSARHGTRADTANQPKENDPPGGSVIDRYFSDPEEESLAKGSTEDDEGRVLRNLAELEHKSDATDNSNATTSEQAKDRQFMEQANEDVALAVAKVKYAFELV